MIKISKGVGFTTDPNGSVERFDFEFTEKDLAKIKLCQNLLKEHGLEAIDIDFPAAHIEHDSDFTPSSVETLKVLNGCVYYNVQSKYTAESQYESEQITNKELGL